MSLGQYLPASGLLSLNFICVGVTSIKVVYTVFYTNAATRVVCSRWAEQLHAGRESFYVIGVFEISFY